MRVLLATDLLPSPARGGLDLHVTDLLAELGARGITVQLACLAEQDLASCLEEIRPDLVHFHSLQGLSPSLPAEARGFGARVLWTLHDFYALCPRTHLHDGELRACSGPQAGRACGPCFGGIHRLIWGLRFPRRWSAMRKGLDACDRLLAASFFVRDLFVADGLSPARIEVLQPAVRVPERPATAADPSSRPRFVYAGDLRRAKGADLVIRALELLECDCELAVHGGPPLPPAPPEKDYQEELRDLAKARAVRFGGRYDPREMLSLLDAAVALVVPSRVRESFGRTANEALLAQVPVLAPAGGGLAEQIEEGVNGWLFESGNAGSLAGAMKRMIESRDTLSPRGGKAGGATWPEPARLGTHVDRLLALYEELL